MDRFLTEKPPVPAVAKELTTESNQGMPVSLRQMICIRVSPQ